MALHTQLPIYQVAEKLFWLVDDLILNMQRDIKQRIGQRIANECTDITVLVFRANVAEDKVPHLSLPKCSNASSRSKVSPAALRMRIRPCSPRCAPPCALMRTRTRGL